MALARGGLIRFGRRAQPGEPEPPTADELFTAMQTPVLVLDSAGAVQRCNGAAELMLNMAQAAMAGMAIGPLLGLPAGHAALSAVSAEAPFAAYDVDIAVGGGRPQRADLMVSPLPDSAGWRVLAIHRRAPSVARRGERGARTAIGAAAMLAHEIKNPLSGIRGAAQLLEASADPDSADLTRLIREEVDRIAALIDRMEGFTDTRPLGLGPQNIHAIIGHARDVAASGFARGIAIRELYDPSLPPVLGHRDALVQVILNLLKNAAEATGEGAAITLTTAYRHGVSVTPAGGDRRVALPIEVCVIDDGPGAPPHIAELLFDPFVTSKTSGSGLGLALVEKLVADQGGIVEYAREGTPPRTVFRILLQRAAHEGPRATA